MCSEIARKSIRWAVRVADWTPTAGEWSHLVSLVSPAERDRIAKFVFRRDAKSALAGRLLARRACQETLGLEWSKMKFERTERGRPFLLQPETPCFDFNVSHQGDWVVCAAEYVPHLTPRIGVDVMKLESRDKPPLEFASIFRRQLSDYEWGYVERGPGSTVLNRFYRVWCLKESYLKADGCGISKDLRSVAFTPRSDHLFTQHIISDTVMNPSEEVNGSWRFHEGFLDDKHCWAVCVNAEISHLVEPKQFEVLKIDDLVVNAHSLSPVNEQDGLDFVSKELS
jgi:4'-phosphopantetheinyl transferase